jgi:hypothetical protein
LIFINLYDYFDIEDYSLLIKLVKLWNLEILILERFYILDEENDQYINFEHKVNTLCNFRLSLSFLENKNNKNIKHSSVKKGK